MQAFPKVSANKAIGASGPLNKDIDPNLFHGNRGTEAFSDFSKSGTVTTGYEPSTERLSRPPLESRPPSYMPGGRPFDPIARVDPVHGDESLGLGTSTFLEGAPASRIAMKRRESESEVDPTQSGLGGLGRKKSIVQKIRGINPSRNPSRRVGSPEQRYELTNTTSPRELRRPFTSDGRPGRPFTSDGAGPARRPTEHLTHSKSPSYTTDYDEAYDQKGQSIAVAEKDHGVRFDDGDESRRGLERRITSDGSEQGGSGSVSKPMGFLSRVKSLKGGRRARPTEGAY